MIAEIGRHRDELVRLCGRFGVARLDVFGSATTDEFDPASSDVDFVVDFDPSSGLSRFDSYFGLKEALEALFGRPVDLVVATALANPYLADAVERTREPLYAA